MEKNLKQLLLQDLCARLPYGVILNCAGDIFEKLKMIDENGLINNDWDIDEVKPYLRPMSSMTEEERKEHNLHRLSKWNTYSEYCANVVDWLNKKMFDYRGLIPKDLAISTEVFNPYKNLKL